MFNKTLTVGPFIPCTPWIPGDPDGPLIEYEKSHQAKQHQLYINKHTCTNKQKKEGGRREGGKEGGGKERRNCIFFPLNLARNSVT